MTEILERPKHLSPSGAAKYRQCPRAWRFRYIEKRPDPSGEAALVGKFAHSVLEELMKLPAKLRTPLSAAAIATSVWDIVRRNFDFVVLGLDEKAQKKFRWKAWRAVEGLWDLEDPKSVHVVSTELKVKTTIWGVPFLGIIDRVSYVGDNLLSVVDYKSGRWVWSDKKRRGAPTEQVLLYAMSLKNHEPLYGDKPNDVGWAKLYYLGSGIVSTPVTEAATEVVGRRFEETWENIGNAVKADEFPPQTGPLCRYCPYRPDCPEGQRAVEGSF